MSRTSIPLPVDDISGFARALRGRIAECDHVPGHLELMNMLARAAGFRNFQHLRAGAPVAVAIPPAGEPRPAGIVDDPTRIRRLARHFDAAGRLRVWPGKHSHREPCLWVLWSRLPARQTFDEKEVNRRLAGEHLFGDHALLRRELCDRGLMTRTADGRAYRRLEHRPPDEALALIRHLTERGVSHKFHVPEPSSPG